MILQSIPVEPFAETGIGIKGTNVNGIQILFSGYSNGSFGYLPLIDAYEEGGYEPNNTPFAAGSAEIVEKICEIMDKMKPLEGMDTYKELITFVKDRPGHDFRYAIDSTKVEKELNFYPSENINTGLTKTITWYLDNLEWINNIRSNKYNQERLGAI